MFFGSKKMKQLFIAASMLLLFALPFAASPQSVAAPAHNADGARPAAFNRNAAMDMDASTAAAAAQHLLKIRVHSPLSSQNRNGSRSAMDAIAGTSAGLSAIPFRRVLQCTQTRLHNELFGVTFNCRAPPAFSAQL